MCVNRTYKRPFACTFKFVGLFTPAQSYEHAHAQRTRIIIYILHELNDVIVPVMRVYAYCVYMRVFVCVNKRARFFSLSLF